MDVAVVPCASIMDALAWPAGALLSLMELNMSAIRLAFANQKGGVGKTTLAVHTALALAQRGEKVLFVDLDPQGNGTRFLSNRTLTENPAEGEGYTRSVELFGPLDTVTPYVGVDGVSLIWAGRNDRALNDKGEVPLAECAHPAMNLAKAGERYDWVLIDTPPTLNKLQLSALLASTHVVCPVKLSGFGLDGVQGLIESIQDVKKVGNAGLEFVGVILNQEATRSRNYSKDVDELKSQIGELVFTQGLGQRRPIDEACSMSKPIWRIYTGAARPAAKEMLGVIDELIGRIGRGA